MKKIFKIASYDFRRLMFFPVAIIIMVVGLIAILIFGAVYKIPVSPAYSASVSGETTKEIFENFNSNSSDLDTYDSLYKLIEEASNVIDVQKSCSDYKDLTIINEKFNNPLQSISVEVEKYSEGLGSTYIEKNNIDEIKTASAELSAFIAHFKTLGSFESNMFFKQEDLQRLEEISAYLEETINKDASINEILDELSANLAKFAEMNSIVQDRVHTWTVDDETLTLLETKYILKAKAKLSMIEAEMSRLNSMVTIDDTKSMQDMTNLVVNFKLTCECSKIGVLNELYMLLENHVGFDSHFKSIENLYGYHPINKEETQIAITQINFFLDDAEVYYTQYQQPLNFNIATGEATAYDQAYLLISIIGFFTVLYGIYAAYKLFGKDRKTGQMDVVLSQDVTYGQVFAGKFFAIVFSTAFILTIFLLFTFVWAILFHNTLASAILAVFNTTSAYTIHPFLFLIIKVFGIQLQVIFWTIITIFLMNLSRRFKVFFGIGVALFAISTICTIFLNGSLVYCLFPFIHADITCFLGGGKMNAGFLQTPLYAYGNFFISLAYYLVVVLLLYNFTNQLFKKN